ncbi:MAG: hypothetical protein HUJ26_05275 [Planctomycetaceae bacterium]|nr:hypothetical protein [Planctomycetaceae bacterium]
MDAYEEIENIIAKKFGKDTTSRKSVGDFMLSDNHAVNVKSNNVEKSNYSPNMISIKKMHKWVFEERNDLSFVFVDYRLEAGSIKILEESDLVAIEHIKWECLSIEAQGYGVIQKTGELSVDIKQTKRDFYLGFLSEYQRYREKERKKHDAFASRFITDPDTIDW